MRVMGRPSSTGAGGGYIGQLPNYFQGMDKKERKDTDVQEAPKARQKLIKFTPRSLGQAMRIPGVTPAAIAVLSTYVSRYSETCLSEKSLPNALEKPV